MKEGVKYCVSQGYVLREILGESVIVPVDKECLISNAVITPNDTAVFLWRAFQKPSTKEEVIQKCMEEYEAAEGNIRDSVERFVQSALEYRFLKRVS